MPKLIEAIMRHMTEARNAENTDFTSDASGVPLGTREGRWPKEGALVGALAITLPEPECCHDEKKSAVCPLAPGYRFTEEGKYIPPTHIL